MRAVWDHGGVLVEDPTRLDGVAALGLDETSFLKATRLAPTRYVTGLVDLERGRLLEVVADRTRAAVDGWLGARPRGWLAGIATVALDPGAATPVRWSHRLATRPWSWTASTLPVGQRGGRPGPPPRAAGHPRASGRKPDPLYRIRKLLLTAAEQLTQRGRARLRAAPTWSASTAGQTASG
jgi:hypothetical protein